MTSPTDPTTTQVSATYVTRHNCTPYLAPAINDKKVLACGQTFTCSACKRVYTVQQKIEFGGEPQPQLVCTTEPLTTSPLIVKTTLKVTVKT